MTPQERAVNFVHQHVKEFEKRHMKAMLKKHKVPSFKELVAASGNEDLIAAVQKTLDLRQQIEELEKQECDHAVACMDKFGAISAKLMEEAVDAAATATESEHKEFMYELRDAIGKVELVSPEAAYEVLDHCRNKLRELGELD